MGAGLVARHLAGHGPRRPSAFIGLHARAALPGMLAIVEDWRPDVVLRETLEFASALAAERHDVR